MYKFCNNLRSQLQWAVGWLILYHYLFLDKKKISWPRSSFLNCKRNSLVFHHPSHIGLWFWPRPLQFHILLNFRVRFYKSPMLFLRHCFQDSRKTNFAEHLFHLTRKVFLAALSLFNLDANCNVKPLISIKTTSKKSWGIMINSMFWSSAGVAFSPNSC